MFVFEEDVELVLLSFERDRQVPFLLKSKPTFSVGRRRGASLFSQYFSLYTFLSSYLRACKSANVSFPCTLNRVHL